MKKKLKQFSLATIAGVALVSGATFSNTEVVYANEHVEIKETSYRYNETGYKYMTIDGVLYKRLWSYTYERWEDTYWTPA